MARGTEAGLPRVRVRPARPSAAAMSTGDLGHAVMWVAAAARLLAAGGLGAEAEDLQRVLDRVAMLRRGR